MSNKNLLPKLLLIIIWAGILCFTSACKGKSKDDVFLPADLISNPGQSTGDISKVPIIEFKETEHDFGAIKEGQVVFWSFKFKNTGKSDLILNRVKADCGCTVPEYPTTPIAPGEENKIRVTFDSKGRPGRQIKNITVLSNSEKPTIVLTISALVEK